MGKAPGQVYLKSTKIVATISSSGTTAELIRDLQDRGMDVVRLNSAHMSISEMEGMIRLVRSVSPYLAVMVDTKGPNIRTCDLAEEVTVQKGDVVRISGVAGNDGRILVNYAPFAEEVPVGSRLVMDDGAAAFRVTGKENGALISEALFDCVIRNKKSINVPDVSLKAPALTDRDREFLAAAVRLDCDLIAHSFVRSAADVQEVRNVLGEAGRDIGVIAKIENREGVSKLDEILDAADGVMVARGDLGIEIPLEEVPAIQKMMIYKARLRAKPVITATQMLQSMETSPVPTRAEVSDVANAVYDGTDAVMLSGETAHGNFPREAVDMMKRIVCQAELAPKQFFTLLKDIPETDPRAAFVLRSAVASTEQLPVRLIICSTLRGRSAMACSAMRPRVPIFAPTPSEKVCRKLALNFGVYPKVVPYQANPTDQVKAAVQDILKIVPPNVGSETIALISKHSENVQRNDIFCLTTLDELK